tara:strand:+ start:839 stop:1597 length:759 start_codon:yes stop_codon:yes gene_type:complete
MSEETRTKKEIEADIALREAEARKTQAEAVNVELKGKQLQLDITKSQIDLKLKEFELSREQKVEDQINATDAENRLYRFAHEVSELTVGRCMSRLTEWSRTKPGCSMEIIFSSPGGSIIDGFELFDHIQQLRNDGHHITTGTLGMAASMAGILLQAGDTRWVGQQAWVMIHRAAFGAWGKTFEIEDEVKFVKRMEERILDIFTSRSKLSRNKIKRNWDRKDWWISAEEAITLGLVDEIRATMPEHRDTAKEK